LLLVMVLSVQLASSASSENCGGDAAEAGGVDSTVRGIHLR
jgi:hypothetical protein